MGTHDEDGVARRRFDVADAAPLLLDGRGVVTSWTRDAERLLGYPSPEAVGKDLAGLLTDADAGRVPDILERCRRDGGWSGLLSARRGDGRPVPVMARFTSADEPGTPSRWLVLLNEMGDAPGWTMSRFVLEQMVTGSPVGIAIVDTDLRFVWSNEALARFGGGRPGDRLGLRFADVQPGLDAEAAEAQMRRVLESGETVVGYEHVGHLRAAPHRETAHMLSFTRLEDEHGNAMGVYYTVVDITDRHRARQRLALLDRAGRRIGSSLDIARTAQELADVAVPGFADAVAVDLLEPVLRGAEPAPGLTTAGPGDSVPLRRAGLRIAGTPRPGGPATDTPDGSPPAPTPTGPATGTDHTSPTATRPDAPTAAETATDTAESPAANRPGAPAATEAERTENAVGRADADRPGARAAAGGVGAADTVGRADAAGRPGAPPSAGAATGTAPRPTPNRPAATDARTTTEVTDRADTPATAGREADAAGRPGAGGTDAPENTDPTDPHSTAEGTDRADAPATAGREADAAGRPGPAPDAGGADAHTDADPADRHHGTERADAPAAAGGEGSAAVGGGAEDGGAVRYPAGSPPVRCLLTGQPWRAERLDASAGEWLRDMEAKPEAASPSDPVDVLIVPVRARGATLGVTTFLRRRRREPFDADDVALAEDLVSRAAVCVDNARRYTRERDAALVLQRSLLPQRLPEQDAVEVAACYRPADELTGLGGDWYDLIPLSAARVALVVGEVPGHGIDAAAAMGRVRTAVRTLAALDLPPEEVLAHLDDLVARTSREEGREASTQAQGAGCVYVVYDPVDGRCAMAAAGHPAPAVVLPDGTITFVDLPQGPPLGAGGPPFESVETVLPEGSTLALHTDGLLAQGEEWALDADRTRLRQALERRADTLDLRCQAVIDALVPARPFDDVALLMARTRRLSADRVAEWELPADPAAVSEARKTASRRLTEWGLAELSFTTELVVSELVTNAIRYATGPIRLRLIRERTLVCEVFDGGATAPHLRHPRTTDEGGRGLLLVSQVTQRWGTRFLPEGKIIWAEQSVTDPGG
ncbi:SpoIIE family protein phosphatase [Streptomyces sp. NPDC001381]|uniref:SpoIIE family protein phosphatase n=1 Tax=Streptomyces sp. NPDC001381 TaxID=3364567 RepID=UPI0036D04B9D